MRLTSLLLGLTLFSVVCPTANGQGNNQGGVANAGGQANTGTGVTLGLGAIALQGVLKFPITWGVSSRRVVFGRYPDTVSSFQGRLDNSAVLAQGGVFQQPQLYPVNVMEILRCTTVSLRRRMELMGAVGPHDPL